MKAHRSHAPWSGTTFLKRDGVRFNASLNVDPLWEGEPDRLQETWGDAVEQLMVGLKRYRGKGLFPGMTKSDLRRNRKRASKRMTEVLQTQKEQLRKEGMTPYDRSVKLKRREMFLLLRRIAIELGRRPTIREFGAMVDLSGQEFDARIELIGGAESLYTEAFTNWPPVYGLHGRMNPEGPV